MNPSQPAFWSTTYKPTDQPMLAPINIDVDAAVKNALANRTDILQLKKQIESTDISVKFAQNQRQPGVDLQARYGEILEDRRPVVRRPRRRRPTFHTQDGPGLRR